MQSELIPAEVLEACRVPPPHRNDWYLVLYVTNRNEWALYTGGGGSTVRFLSEDSANAAIFTFRLRDARIIRIPGEG